jgi:hypothetical protein
MSHRTARRRTRQIDLLRAQFAQADGGRLRDLLSRPGRCGNGRDTGVNGRFKTSQSWALQNRKRPVGRRVPSGTEGGEARGGLAAE